MAENDVILLQRYATGASREAFAELVRRHVRRVYATSWRVLKNENDALDVTQETFYDLMRQAGRVSGSLAGWLHRVATRKSIDLVQCRVRRRRREQAYVETRPVEVRTWEQLSGHVDEALEMLDPVTKSLLLAHFIAGESTARIAREQGVSKATVSRRVNAGLEQLRGVLRRKGLLVATAALGAMLTDNASQAVSATVLSKMATITTTRAAATTTARAGAVKALLTTAALVGVVAVVGYLRPTRSTPVHEESAAPAPVERPAVPQAAPARASQDQRAAITRSSAAPAAVSDSGQLVLIQPQGSVATHRSSDLDYQSLRERLQHRRMMGEDEGVAPSGRGAVFVRLGPADGL